MCSSFEEPAETRRTRCLFLYKPNDSTRSGSVHVRLKAFQKREFESVTKSPKDGDALDGTKGATLWRCVSSLPPPNWSRGLAARTRPKNQFTVVPRTINAHRFAPKTVVRIHATVIHALMAGTVAE